MAILVAHRGFRDANQENRMIDFENALKICRAVEFDIRLTKDKQVIIFHDDTFKRITGDDIKVNSLSYQEIKLLKFFQANPMATPPLLLDFITKLSQYYQMINIEIKEDATKQYNNKDLTIIFATIKKLLNYTKAEIIVATFNQALLQEINNHIKLPIKKGYLFASKREFQEEIAKNFDYLHPQITTALDSEIIKKFKALNKPLNIWTFTTNEAAQKINQIYQQQVYGYISDNPNLKWDNK